MKTHIHFWSHFAHFFLEWEIFQTKVVEKLKVHIWCTIKFFLESCSLWDNVEKYSRDEEPSDNNMEHAHGLLDTCGYKHILGFCNNYCFSIATVVAPKRLNVMLCVNCLFCYHCKHRMPCISSYIPSYSSSFSFRCPQEQSHFLAQCPT